MMEYSKKDLVASLKDLGLARGDVVKASTELFKLGRLKNVSTKEEYCQTIFDAIFEVIGDEGTLAVNTYTTYVGRYGLPFHYEKSKPTTGVFPEYILFQTDSIRSLHPLNSMAAVGRYKKEICLNVSGTNYGWGSPFDRLLRRNCKVLRLGLDPVLNAFFHVTETMCGLPYLYNKVLDVEVFCNGKKIDKTFLASVRYLEYDTSLDVGRLENELATHQIIRSQKIGAGTIYCLDANDYCRIVMDCFSQDPYFFLKTPPIFKKGVIPRDGITKNRDNVGAKSDYLFKENVNGSA